MTDTLQTQLDALRTAYRSGTLRVSYDNKSVEYRSNKELLEAINSLERELGAVGPVNVVVRSRRRF